MALFSKYNRQIIILYARALYEVGLYFVHEIAANFMRSSLRLWTK